MQWLKFDLCKNQPIKKYYNSEPIGASKASTLDKYFNDLYVHEKRVFQSLPNDVYSVMECCTAWGSAKQWNIDFNLLIFSSFKSQLIFFAGLLYKWNEQFVYPCI